MRNLITDIRRRAGSAMPVTPSSAPARPSSFRRLRRRARRARRRAGHARDRVARPGADGGRDRRHRALGRLGLRARRRLRRAGLLREQGRGFQVREARVPIVPAAILFDLLAGGDKDWGRYPPYRELGYEAAKSAGSRFALGSVGAGLGATSVNLKGGIGSASAQTRDGLTVGAIVAANAAGSVDHRRRPAFLGRALRAGQGIRRPRLAGHVHRRRDLAFRSKGAPGATPRSRSSPPTPSSARRNASAWR